jgi:hypothetical protein
MSPFSYIRLWGLCFFLTVAGSACRKQSTLAPPVGDNELRRGDQSLAAGDRVRAAEFYERYLELTNSPEERAAVTLRLALLHLLPGGVEDQERTRQLLSTFLEDNPRSHLGPEMRMVLEMRTRLDRLLNDVRAASQETRQRRQEIAALEEEVRSLTVRLGQLEEEKDRLEQARELAEAHLRLRSRRIRQLAWELEEERRQRREVARLLEELKEIDVWRRRPR